MALLGNGAIPVLVGFSIAVQDTVIGDDFSAAFIGRKVNIYAAADIFYAE
jgi:hypothetical protein